MIEISGLDHQIQNVRVEFYPSIKSWSAYYKDVNEGKEGTLYVGNGESLEEALTNLERRLPRRR